MNKKLNKNEIINVLFEGDCLEIMKKFPDNSIDLVLCDLPYGTTQNKWDSVINFDSLSNQTVKPRSL